MTLVDDFDGGDDVFDDVGWHWMTVCMADEVLDDF